MTLSETTSTTTYSDGETAILILLDEMKAQLDELTEKLNNLNLSYNEGFSTYDTP